MFKAVPPVRLGTGEVMQRECRRVYYSGRVQGVGFRFTAYRVSRGFDVAGYVRNLPDGRVELVAEGAPAELDAFVRAVRDAMDPYIRDMAVEPCVPSSPPVVEFTVQID
jgi:acylphosphatase